MTYAIFVVKSQALRKYIQSWAFGPIIHERESLVDYEGIVAYLTLLNCILLSNYQ
jgi:hypothetical protein